MNSFTEKYKPKNVDEIVGQKSSISKIITFLNSFPKNKKALMIEGQSGVGKTVSVDVISKSMNYEIVEITPSQLEDGEYVEKVFGNLVKSGSIFGKKKLIVIDFLESLNFRTIAQVIKLIKETHIPIILIVLDSWNQKFRTLRYYCDVITFRKLSSIQISNKLMNVLNEENIKFEKPVLDFLSKNSDGDLRAALNDLEIICIGKSSINEKDVVFVESRRIEEDIFKGLQKIFKSPFSKEILNVFESANLDLNMGILWVSENLSKEYRNPTSLKKAYNFISRSDVFLGRIKRRQYWRFYTYSKALSTAGVNLSKENKKNIYSGFVRYTFPSKISELSKTKKLRKTKKSIASKMSEDLYVSRDIFVNEYIPLLKFLIKNEPKLKKELSQKYNLKKPEVDILVK